MTTKVQKLPTVEAGTAKAEGEVGPDLAMPKRQVVVQLLVKQKIDGVVDPFDERAHVGGRRRLVVLERHMFQTADIAEASLAEARLAKAQAEIDELVAARRPAARRSALASKTRRAGQTQRGR